MILDFVFVPADLLLDLVQSRIESCNSLIVFVAGHEIVTMLGVDEDFDLGLRVLEIDDHFDLRDTLKVRQKFF